MGRQTYFGILVGSLLLSQNVVGNEERKTFELSLTERWKEWVLEEIVHPCREQIGHIFEVEDRDDKLSFIIPDGSLGKVAKWIMANGIPKLTLLDVKEAKKMAKQVGHWMTDATKQYFMKNGSSSALSFQLGVDENVQDRIAKLISGLAETSEWKLALPSYRKPLEVLSDSLKPVHPLQVLAGATSTAYLRKCMHKILDSTLKRRSFMGKMEAKLKRAKDQGKLMEEIIICAEELNRPAGELIKYAEREDWFSFVQWFAR